MSRAAWLAEKRAESITLGDLPLPEIVPSRRDFTQFIATQRQGLALIARLQRANPDTGATWPDLDMAAFARACDDAETAALAVRTATMYGGRLADLDTVVAAASAPVLRDDLCLDRQQIYAARLHGADAVLLPAAELDTDALRELAAVAGSVHMAAVVEVGTRAHLDSALALPTACIGINSMGGDGRADLVRVRALAGQIPRHRTALLLAEVAALDDLIALAGVIDAAVVGDVLLTAADPGAAVAGFLARLG
jgi:indole-3-glycerol phosphate synthase